MKKEFFLAATLSILLTLFTVFFFVRAWQEPTQTPPGQNAYAPINVGPTAQTKTGNLTLPNLYLNAAANEGNIQYLNQLIGYNDIFVKGNAAETAPVYLAGNQISVYTSGTERLRIDSSGNVGIGTTGPNEKLQIGNAFAFHDGGNKVLGFGYALGAGVDLDPSGYAAEIRLDPTNGKLYFGVSNSTTSAPNTYLVTIQSNGNVGIGTTTPAYKLDVVGALRLQPSSAPTGANGVIYYDSSSNKFRCYQNGSWVDCITAAGASFPLLAPLGSATNPSYSFSGDTNTGIFSAGADILSFTTGGTERMRINSSGNVGIGTTNPAYRLDISGDVRWSGTLQGGSVPWQRLTSFPSACPSGQFVTAVGSTLNCATPSVSGGVTGSGSQNYLAKWTGSTTLGNSIIYDNGNIGIGTTSPSYKLDVSGEVRASAFYYSSDINLKTNIKPLENSLAKILQLQGFSFNWKDNQEPSIGLLAQEVEKVFPELVSGKDGSKTVDYGKLVPVLIEAIKEQQREIEKLKLEIEKIKSK
jgi:trimeric autotransporter adhesin